MRLIAPTHWAAKYFAEPSKPDEKQCYRWLRSGKVPGRKVGGKWFVDEDEWLADGDDLVRRVLEAG